MPPKVPKQQSANGKGIAQAQGEGASASVTEYHYNQPTKRGCYAAYGKVSIAFLFLLFFAVGIYSLIRNPDYFYRGGNYRATQTAVAMVAASPTSTQSRPTQISVSKRTPTPIATFTPPPPAASPTPDYPFKIAEGPIEFPTTEPVLHIYIALTDANNTPIQGLRVVGEHIPSGAQWVSKESCSDFCVANIYDDKIMKFGNVVFSPPKYLTGVWNLYVIDSKGNQVSGVISVSIDLENPGWYFILLRR